MPWPCLVAEALCLNSSGPETMAPETLVPEEIAPSNPKALGLTISMALGTCAEAETSVSVGRGWEYAERAATRNAG